MKKRKLIAAALIIVSTLAATFSFYFWQVAKSPNLNVENKENFYLLIPSGGTYENVVDSLKAHKIINDAVSFGFLAKFMKYREHVKAGRYEIKPNSGNRDVLVRLRAGEQTPVKLTFNNIRTKGELAEKFGNRFEFKNSALVSELKNPEICQKYGLDTTTIMCMFLPNTYFFHWNITPEKFMDRMFDEYQKFWTGEHLAKAKEIGLTPVQVSVLASVVQGETNKNDEKPRVAGVYWNRLQQNIPLQADPTVKFAVGDFTLKRILFKHLAVESLYNTYRHTGLPPGPISLPEISSLNAVLDKENHNFVYFCAKEDFSGYHNFAITLSEHNENARKYQEALNKMNIR
jgi:UPF0755 protein